VGNSAFATLALNGEYSLFGISVLTGRSTWLGRFDDAVVDVALPLDQ
jgi:hypothetical protein